MGGWKHGKGEKTGGDLRSEDGSASEEAVSLPLEVFQAVGKEVRTEYGEQ